MEGLLTAQSIVSCLEAMTGDPECVAKGRMDHQKSLRLPGRLEAPHVAFPPPAVLVGNLGPVVLVPSGSMGCRQPGVSAGGRIASQLVRDQLPWRSTLPLQGLQKKRLAALASRRRVTRTSPPGFTALQR